MEQQTTAFREYFFRRNKKWMLSNLPSIFTPRSLERYRPQLSLVYQRLLNLQPPFQYQLPVVPSGGVQVVEKAGGKQGGVDFITNKVWSMRFLI